MLAATILALMSAGLHASWNFMVKTSDDRFLAAWGQFLFGGLIFAPVLVVTGIPNLGEVWPYLLASGLVHIAYIGGLTTAYHHGDFSLAYPLARGSGALLSAVGGVLFLGDVLNPWAWVAIVVVLVGLLALVGRQVTYVSVAWALATGACIGTYTTIDAAGSRASDGLAYGIAVTIAGALALTLAGTVTGRLGDLGRALPFAWRRYALAGVFLTVAYTLVMIAVQWAPVGYVAVLRESSVMVGALAGWVLLKERLGGRRLAASAVVASGLALLVVVR